MATKMTDGTGGALMDWLDRAAERGWLNKNTAGGYRAACQRILEVETAWEELDLSALDVDGLIQRFVNLKGGDYSPKSLETYKSRFRNAVEIYLDWAKDPSSWKLPSSSRAKRDSRTTAPSARASSEAREPERAMALDRRGEGEMIAYPFPLREDVDVKLLLPRDLRTEEAKRLVAFINALALDDPGRDQG